MITIDRLKALLYYDRVTGLFIRLTSAGGKEVGSAAGTVNPDGYVQIQLDGRFYKAHRLAWFYVYGVWPRNQIDHKDLVRCNNAIDNLRLATNAENNRNKTKTRDALSAYKGVTFDSSRGKWKAQIKVNYKNIFLGRFESEQEAHTAYVVASREYHADFGRTA